MRPKQQWNCNQLAERPRVQHPQWWHQQWKRTLHDIAFPSGLDRFRTKVSVIHAETSPRLKCIQVFLQGLGETKHCEQFKVSASAPTFHCVKRLIIQFLYHNHIPFIRITNKSYSDTVVSDRLGWMIAHKRALIE